MRRARSRDLLKLDVVNDLTGDEEHGYYDVYLYLPDLEHGGFEEVHARVEGYDRSLGWKPLMVRALAAVSKAKG